MRINFVQHNLYFDHYFYYNYWRLMELKDIHHYTSYQQSISFENKHSWKKDAKPLTKHYQRLIRFKT